MRPLEPTPIHSVDEKPRYGEGKRKRKNVEALMDFKAYHEV
jgi:hypothetical protein